MAHRTSASALHAARIVLKEFDLTPRPVEELPYGQSPIPQPGEFCLAITIDLATKVYLIAELRPKLRYWTEKMFFNSKDSGMAGQILTFFKEVVEAFDQLPQRDMEKMTTVLETPREFGRFASPVVYEINKPSIEASRFIFHYYRVTARNGINDDAINRVKVAKLVDASTGIPRIMEAVPLVKHWKQQLQLGRATEQDIRGCLRRLGIILEYLSNYEDRREETVLL